MIRTIIAVAILVGLTVGAQASVLCGKKNGALLVREACKGKETQLDPAALGLVGPAGAQGVPGAPGQPGAAGPAGPGARWALVLADGTIAAQSGGITITSAVGGNYYVNFGSSQAGKTIQVSASVVGDDFLRGTTGADLCGGGVAGFACPVEGTNNDSHVRVFTSNPANTVVTPHAFHIAVF